MFFSCRCLPLAVRSVPVFSGAAARVPGDAVRTIRGPRTRYNMVHCARLQRWVRILKVSLPHLSNYTTTSMHSSRMRTARLLPVSPSMYCAGGRCLVPGGVSAPSGGGVCHSPPLVNRMTDRCKSITLSQLCCRR